MIDKVIGEQSFGDIESSADGSVYYYSASTHGFYTSTIHGADIPEDAVVITEECWQQLLNGQSAGKVIVPAENGYPILVDPPPPTLEQVTAAALAERAARMADATAAIAPLQDAVDLGEATEGEEKALREWKQYRIDINRVSRQEGFPETIQWPEQPGVTG